MADTQSLKSKRPFLQITPTGRFVVHVFETLDQFERDMIHERTSQNSDFAAAR